MTHPTEFVEDQIAPRRCGRVVAFVLVPSLLLVAVLTALWVGGRDSRIDLHPEYFIGVDGQSSIDLLDGAVDVTATACGEQNPCESAWGTDQMVLMKFTSKNEAALAARTIGADAYRSDWLVANFIGDSVSEFDRQNTAEVLDGAWQSEVD